MPVRLGLEQNSISLSQTQNQEVQPSFRALRQIFCLHREKEPTALRYSVLLPGESPLVLRRTLLTLLVTKFVQVFPTPSNSLQYQLGDLQLSSITTLSTRRSSPRVTQSHKTAPSPPLHTLQIPGTIPGRHQCFLQTGCR